MTALPSEEYLQEAELKVWVLVHCSKENLLGSLAGKKTIANLILYFSEFYVVIKEQIDDFSESI